MTTINIKSQAEVDVLVERDLQREKYDLVNDNGYAPGELAEAANLSIFMAGKEDSCTDGGIGMRDKGQRQNLVRAAAFLIAEIERMDRLGGG